jgi:hypothetical protein
MTMPDAYLGDTVELLARELFEAGQVSTDEETWESITEDDRDSYRKVVRAQFDVLAERGLLLPEGAEQRTEWGVWWYGLVGNGIHLTREGFTSKHIAEDYAPSRIGDYGITRYEIWKREHRNWADGSSWSGPWSPIPPEPKEGSDA